MLPIGMRRGIGSCTWKAFNTVRLNHAAKQSVAERVSGRNLPKTDVQPADEFGLITVQLLVTQWYRSPTQETPLIQAIACARYITSKSPCCVHAHFLLLRLYRLIGLFCKLRCAEHAQCNPGTPSLIVAPLSALKPVEIQLDNLLHPLFERGSTDHASGQTTAIFATYAEKANSMHRKAAIDASFSSDGTSLSR